MFFSPKPRARKLRWCGGEAGVQGTGRIRGRDEGEGFRADVGVSVTVKVRCRGYEAQVKDMRWLMRNKGRE